MNVKELKAEISRQQALHIADVMRFYFLIYTNKNLIWKTK